MMLPRVRDGERILRKSRLVAPHVCPSQIRRKQRIEKSMHTILHHDQLHLYAKWRSNLIDSFRVPFENTLENRNFLAMLIFGPGLLGNE
jgi:hypothetical protein